MATKNQKLGEKGEILVTQNCSCPNCKNTGSLRRLPNNFKCADIICDFCGYLTQVKTKRKKDIETLPTTILGGAWGVQKERMDAGIYFSLYIVLINEKDRFAIYYLSSDLQTKELFVARKPLADTARRSGWQGFYYDLTKVIPNSIVRLV